MITNIFTTIAVLLFTSCSNQTNDNTNTSVSTENIEQINSEPGAKDADELGRKIVAAFKQNNAAAYSSCIIKEDKSVAEAQFKNLYEEFKAKGLSDWSKVKFIRVRYFTNKDSDILGGFKIEFESDKLSGMFGGVNSAEKHDGRYYLRKAYRGCNVDRK